MRILLMIFVLNVILNANVYAESEQIFVVVPQTAQKSSEEILSIFETEEEKCIVLAFEPQLETFGKLYIYHFGKPTSRQLYPKATLQDVATLYYSYDKKGLDEFLDFVIAPSSQYLANSEVNVAMFREKVWQDYKFIKDKRKIRDRQKNREDVMYNSLVDLANNPVGQRILGELIRRLNELEKGGEGK